MPEALSSFESDSDNLRYTEIVYAKVNVMEVNLIYLATHYGATYLCMCVYVCMYVCMYMCLPAPGRESG